MRHSKDNTLSDTTENESIGNLEPAEEEFMLSDININIKRGDLVCIIGKVGSGKSSLLRAILGDMKSVNDSFSNDHEQSLMEDEMNLLHKNDRQPISTIKIGGSISYVQQEPWIQHKTIKENIVGMGDNAE
jgi:ATP-binding cassette, subfamily C (CFTR/MRP), member 1